MPNRLIDPRIEELHQQGKKVYSISKANTIEECLYEAYRAYVLHDDGQDGIYGILGTRIHDKLEEIMQGKASPKELSITLKEEINDLDMLGIEFPKDMKGNDTIRQNWIADMAHFCNTFVPPEGKFDTEEFFLYPLTEDRYAQGYIDLIKHHEDGSISIYDWKTSSEFSVDNLLHHGRQLVLYAIAKESQGFRVRNVAWVMLKYCRVSYVGKKRANSKKDTLVEKIVNRGKLVQTLKEQIEQDLYAAGYDSIDIECMLDRIIKENSLDSLPEEIQSRYTIKPYVHVYELNDEIKQECINYLNQMADRFEQLDCDDPNVFLPRNFMKLNRRGTEVEDTFFCHVLCNYRNSCKYIKEFDELKQLEKQDVDNLF